MNDFSCRKNVVITSRPLVNRTSDSSYTARLRCIRCSSIKQFHSCLICDYPKICVRKQPWLLHELQYRSALPLSQIWIAFSTGHSSTAPKLHTLQLGSKFSWTFKHHLRQYSTKYQYAWTNIYGYTTKSKNSCIALIGSRLGRTIQQ